MHAVHAACRDAQCIWIVKLLDELLLCDICVLLISTISKAANAGRHGVRHCA